MTANDTGNHAGDRAVAALLRDAFDAEARNRVGEAAPIPAARYREPADELAAFAPRAPRHGASAGSGDRRIVRLLAPLAAAAAVVLAAGVGVALTRGPSTTSGRPQAAASPISSAARSSQLEGTTLSARAGAPRRAPGGAPVAIKLESVGSAAVGTGLPVVAYFAARFGEASDLTAATSVTVDGRQSAAAWHFERSAVDPGYPIEGHLRMRDTWPANATVSVQIAAKGVAAGNGMAFADSVGTTFRTGDAVSAVVESATHTMQIRRDGRVIASYPVSLGKQDTPTMRGTKVVMAKNMTGIISDPAGSYDDHSVRWMQRLSYDGEYILAAPWNNGIGRTNLSNGCVDMRVGDARAVYRDLTVGDLVTFPDANGPMMRLGSGLGDWNVAWSTWRRGGLIPTS